MKTGTFAFLLGILALTRLPFLPASGWFILLPVCLLLAWRVPQFRLLLFFFCGLCWATAQAVFQQQHVLPAALEGETLTLTGRIAGLPESDQRSVRFNFRVQRLERRGIEIDSASLPRRVRLSWYGPRPELAPGETWQLQVRLKRPQGFMNPGGFDYEAWLFQNRIHATGYVRDGPAAMRLQPASVLNVDGMRDRLRNLIRDRFGRDRAGALLAALTVGDRSGLQPDDWQTLRLTGTSHLLAISGLHIGLIAGLVFFPIRAAWSLWPGAVRHLPAQHAAAALALAFAAFYAALAGFALPTQRALLMLTVATIALLSRRRFRAGDILAAALLAVLLIDPFAVLAAGFWLSFAAVAAILWGMGSRLRQQGLWWRYGHVQVIAAIGLLPLLLLWFQEYPVLGAIANLFAVPWVGLIIMPLLLLAFLLWPLWNAAGDFLLFMAAQGLDWLWLGLQFLAAPDIAALYRPTPGLIALLVGTVGTAILLLPAAVPGRWLGGLWLAPLIWPVLPAIPGELRLTVLDVGQGLAAVVQTREHVLVYDTGPRFSERFDAGSAAVIPFLHQAGHYRLNKLVISHADNDHIGGAPAILASLPVGRTLVNDPDARQLRGHQADACRYGQSWQWDNIEFRILHPDADFSGSPNDASCVLHIRAGAHTVMLPGDIERRAEMRLVDRLGPDQLVSTLLVAPHHGSRTSSTPALLNAVAPEYAVFATGYRNRYGFPNRDIIRRYQLRDVRLFNTATTGAITFDFTQTGIHIHKHRQAQRRFWHLVPDASHD